MNVNNCDGVRPHQTRKIRPTRRSVSGIYAFRGETAIPFESTLERDFLLKKEFSRHVLTVIPQPVQIPFIASNERAYTYTPDFLVYYRLPLDARYGDYPKPLLVEVKPRAEIRKHWRDWKSKFRAALHYAKKQGWDYRIHDEVRIRDQMLNNIRFLERYKRMQFPAEETRWVLDNVRRMGGAPFHYILARHFMGSYRGEGISHIWYLLATGQLECDITRPLGDDTEFWVPNNEL
ncbi:MAG TPA: heteromeric transposase endonuclease subunit TnsA [Chthoniobacterales bacterium]